MTVEKMKTLLVKGAFAGALLLVIVLVCRYVLAWVLPFLFGFLIAYILRPVAGFVDRHSGMGARGASIVSAVFFYAVAGGALWLIGYYAGLGISSVVSALPGVYTDTIEPFFADLAHTLKTRGIRTGSVLNMANEALGGAAASASRWGMDFLGSVLKKLPVIALTLIFTILSSVLICMDYQKVVDAVLHRIPLRWQHLILETRDFVFQSMGKAIKAYLVLTALTFAELLLGLWVLRVSRFPLIAVVIALLDLLPILGSGTVLIPWAVYSILSDKLLLGWGLIALWAVISTIRQLLEPRVVGGQIGLHPLVTLTAMYAGFRIAGFGGMITAPLVCLLAEFLSRKGVLPRW